MKQWLLLALLLWSTMAMGQGTQSQLARSIYSGTGVPTLNCKPGPIWRDVYIRTTDNSEYQCTAAPNIWTKVTSGSPASSLTINSTNGVVPYRTSATAFGDSPITRLSSTAISVGEAGAGEVRVCQTASAACASGYTSLIQAGDKAGLYRSSAGDHFVYYDTAAGHTVLDMVFGGGAIDFNVLGVNKWTINSSGHFLADTDNTVDIGASGATRPRTGYFGTSVEAPTINGTTAIQVNGVSLLPVLSGTTGSIGGGLLTVGTCSSGTVSITGATTSMGIVATPATYPGDGIFWNAYVSSANTVTVKVCSVATLTPTASTYSVRVVQ